MQASTTMIAALILGSMAMVGVIGWYYQRQREAHEAAIMGELAAIAEGKTTQIANWRRERLGDGRVLASSPLMRVAQRFLSTGVPTFAERADLSAVMTQLEKEFLYTGVPGGPGRPRPRRRFLRIGPRHPFWVTLPAQVPLQMM